MAKDAVKKSALGVAGYISVFGKPERFCGLGFRVTVGD